MIKLEYETVESHNGSCLNCPLRIDCDMLTKYTICELLNIPNNLVINKVVETKIDL